MRLDRVAGPMVESLVIGGGPAGAATAILLARAGRSVCLLERKTTPHHKVCGEFISWEAALYLRELGIDPASLGAHPVTHLRLIRGTSERQSALPFTAWSLSRKTLDGALLRQARASGAHVRYGWAVRKLFRQGDYWQVQGRDAALRADTVFLATGKHEVSGWPRSSGSDNKLIGLKMHMRLPPAQLARLGHGVELYLFDEGYGGLEIVEDSVVNFCILISSRVFRHCEKSWTVLLAVLADACPLLRDRLEHARFLWPRPLAISGIPYGYLQKPGPTEPSLFRLGDQAAVIPSMAGDGIAMALHSAFLAAEAARCGQGPPAYLRQMRRHFRAPLRNAQFIDGLLSSSSCRSLVFGLARQWPGLLSAAAQQTRLAPGRLCLSSR